MAAFDGLSGRVWASGGLPRTGPSQAASSATASAGVELQRLPCASGGRALALMPQLYHRKPRLSGAL